MLVCGMIVAEDEEKPMDETPEADKPPENPLSDDEKLKDRFRVIFSVLDHGMRHVHMAYQNLMLERREMMGHCPHEYPEDEYTRIPYQRPGGKPGEMVTGAEYVRVCKICGWQDAVPQHVALAAKRKKGGEGKKDS